MTPQEKIALDRVQNQNSILLDLVTALTTRVEALEKILKGQNTNGN